MFPTNLENSPYFFDEAELKILFDDCEQGAVPALGQVYGLPVIWDKSLEGLTSIYFESGDHQNLIRVDHGSFMQLMKVSIKLYDILTHRRKVPKKNMMKKRRKRIKKWYVH